MTQLSTSINPIPDSWIDALFAKMLALYGNKFADMWRESSMQSIKSVWAQELSKLTREEIARGANALITQDWPPTLPQFIKLCRVEINPLTAYYEAVNGAVARDKGEMGHWSHPAVFWAMVTVGAFDLKNQTYTQIKSRWESCLAEQIARGKWDDVPAPAIALPAPTGKSDPALVEKYIAESQVIKHDSEKVDHKRWAKKIMERHRNGDKTLLPIQIQFAKEALAASAN